jgi:hypothetical protein
MDAVARADGGMKIGLDRFCQNLYTSGDIISEIGGGMYRLLTEEQAKEMMEDAKQRLQREQEERKQKGMHEYQHLVGLADRE